MTADNDNIMIRCRSLTKTYDEIEALKDLNLDIPRSHIFGYIGHNGAGKTTTIRILAGLLTASSGSASIAGVDVSGGDDRIKSLVGYMPDSFGVYDQMRVWEYLDFFGAAFKLPRKQRRKRIEHVFEITSAGYMRDRFVDTLSRGMKQTVGIARTLIHDPKVLLLDEPASGLDPEARVRMRVLLRRLADDGKTLMVSSHILPELAAICDSIGIIHQGVLRISGTIDKVLSQLQRDRLMELKAAGSVGQTVKLLDNDSRCSNVDRTDTGSGLVRFRFKGDDASLAGLLNDIHKSQTKVVTFREVPLSLEDAYMSISGIDSQDVDEEQENDS